MRPKMQKARVLAALRRGRVSRTDFLAPTIDGGDPILNFPARIAELVADGHDVRVVGKRSRCALYALKEPESTATPVAGPASPPAPFARPSASPPERHPHRIDPYDPFAD
jgi:hypothetical protein